MLKKLRIKFVAVLMTIAAVFFGAVFGLVMARTMENMEKESVRMMQSAAQSPPRFAPGEAPDRIRLSSFTVVIGEGGGYDVFGDGHYDLSDRALLDELVNAALSDSERVGVIRQYDLRYLKTESGRSQCIVFADISGERAMIGGLIRNFVVIGLIGFAAFFAVSLLLANWVTKPVEKAWNEQKQFIADASHELKTPLTVIMTNAEMLGDSIYGEDEKQKFTQNISVMSQRMRSLVESLLELARADNGAGRAVYKPLDYSKLVSDSVLPFEPLFYEKNRELICDIEENIRVVGDPEKLSRVVGILLDNAMKYADPGAAVRLSLKRRRAHCVLSVSGKGEPISKADRENIFKRFYRIDKARSGGQSYGLGLSIARRIVGEHHGRIWAQSENGSNAFCVSLERTEK